MLQYHDDKQNQVSLMSLAEHKALQQVRAEKHPVKTEFSIPPPPVPRAPKALIDHEWINVEGYPDSQKCAICGVAKTSVNYEQVYFRNGDLADVDPQYCNK